MEYSFYLEQKYTKAGIVECRIMGADEAERLGYEDDYVGRGDNCKIFVNGFDTEAGAKAYFEDLQDAIMVNSGKEPERKAVTLTREEIIAKVEHEIKFQRMQAKEYESGIHKDEVIFARYDQAAKILEWVLGLLK